MKGFCEVKNILDAKGYRVIRSEYIPECATVKETHMQWLSGPKGVVILQWWTHSDHVQVFVDWPTGTTFKELEAIL